MKNSALYKALGILFYAIAKSDGKVDELEKAKLKQEVQNKWLDFDQAEDAYGSDAAFAIGFAFELNLDQDESSENAWRIFKEFYHQHQSVWTEELKLQVEQTAAALAHAKSAYNKSELGILTDLHLLLNP